MIIDLNPSRGMFIVEIEGGGHALFTLYDRMHLALGDRIDGGLAEMGSERLFHRGCRQQFEAFGETGTASLEECQRVMRG